MWSVERNSTGYGPQSAVHPNLPKPGYSVCREHSPSPHFGSAQMGPKVPLSHSNTLSLLEYTSWSSSVFSFWGTIEFCMVQTIPYALVASVCSYRMPR